MHTYEHSTPKFGVIGLGAISHEYARAMRTHTLQVSAVSDGSPMADGRGNFSYARWVQDSHALIRANDVDVVVVATPPASHMPLTIAALREGKTVVCEKPLCINVHELHTLTTTVAETHGRLYAAYHTRFHPTSREGIARAREKLQSVPLAAIEMTYTEDVRHYHPKSSWIFDRAIAGGGCLMDSGINAISVVESVVGSLTPVHAEFRQDDRYPQVETGLCATYSAPSCPSISLHMDWLSAHEQRSFAFRFADDETITVDLVHERVTTNRTHAAKQPAPHGKTVEMDGEYTTLMADVMRFLSGTERTNASAFTPIATVLETYRT